MGSLPLAGALMAVPGAAATASRGSLLAWGDNYAGQLGNGTTQRSDVPLKVSLPGGAGVVTMAAGGGYALAVTQTGSVLGWGENGDGQLGDGSVTRRARPVSVRLPKGTRVTAVAAGFFHSLALTSTGSVLAWGSNGYGQLGDGTTVDRDLPVRVKLPKGTRVTEVAAGDYYSLALTSSGSVLAWGYNADGELGDGRSTAQSDLPVKVKLPMGTRATAIAGGGYSGLALTSAGSVLGWGDNHFGQLGIGVQGSCTRHKHCVRPVKVKLPSGTRVTAIAGGGYHALALTSAGAVFAWGENQGGQLGDASTTTRHVPVRVKLPKASRVIGIAAGGMHSLGLTSTGSLLAWGSNAEGELGNGQITDRDTPVNVKLPRGDVASAVAAGPGAYFSLATVRHR